MSSFEPWILHEAYIKGISIWKKKRRGREQMLSPTTNLTCAVQRKETEKKCHWNIWVSPKRSDSIVSKFPKEEEIKGSWSSFYFLKKSIWGNSYFVFQKAEDRDRHSVHIQKAVWGTSKSSKWNTLRKHIRIHVKSYHYQTSNCLEKIQAVLTKESITYREQIA